MSLEDALDELDNRTNLLEWIDNYLASIEFEQLAIDLQLSGESS
ncbi:hypothetical protein [Chamaesiphon sp.]